MAAGHRNAMVAAVRMAGQTADIHRDRTAAVRTGVRVEAAGIGAAVLRIAGPVVEAAGLEAAVVVPEAAVVLRMRLRHTVAAESLTDKVEGFPGQGPPFSG